METESVNSHKELSVNLSSWDLGKVLLIDKPLTWTSFDVVNKLRFACKAKKVGHAGTLDPLATGLLIICTGKYTKQIDKFMGMEKEYIGTFSLGYTTPSFDSETEPDAQYPTEHINEALLNTMIEKHLLGLIQQIPPQFSAVKVNGKRLYESAKKGKTVEVSAREVEIKKFTIEKVDELNYNFQVLCSKGTYIRSLINDLGKLANSGAVMTSLRRTAIGDFHIKDAFQLNDLIEKIQLQEEIPSIWHIS